MPAEINHNIDNKIHIALALNENYIVNMYALLTSIFYNNKKYSFCFHAIITGISHLEKEMLKKYILENNSGIQFYDIDEDQLKKDFYINPQYSLATYYKIFFPSLICPSIKKLLYLDSDIIVIGDINELYKIDMGIAPLAAVIDPILLVRYELDMKSTDEYFNAGVMLINTDVWRDQRVTETAIKFLIDYPEKSKFLVDQDALNVALKGKWNKIDRKYNFTWLGEYLQTPTKELLKNKVIIHYITPKKPWHFLTRNKFRYLYHYYLKMSPKSHEKKYVDFKWGIKNIYVFIRIRIKEFYFDRKINKILPIKRWMKISNEY